MDILSASKGSSPHIPNQVHPEKHLQHGAMNARTCAELAAPARPLWRNEAL
jgi:hypothetical protein